MSRLDRYIIFNFIKSFFLGMIMFFLIFLLAESVKITSWLMEGRLVFSDALKYVLYGLPNIISNTAPLGILLGSLLCISKMAKQLEISAMKTSGISFFRITIFPLLFSFLVSLGVLYINYNLLGKYNNLKETMEKEKIDKEPVMRSEKIFSLTRVDRNTILFAEYVNDLGEMRNIEIVKIDDSFSKITSVYTAESGIKNINDDEWTFDNLKEFIIDEDKIEQNSDTSNFEFKVPLSDILSDPVTPENLTMPELRETIVYYSRVGADVQNFIIDFYYRISFSFASFVMSFIGLSLGSKYVRGGAAVNIGASVLIGYSYYGISSIMRSFAVSKTIPVLFACFVPLLIYFFIGIYLYRNAEY